MYLRYRCPQCGKVCEFKRGEGGLPSCFPFCSERCKLIDLGAWLDGKYKISEEISEGSEVKIGKREGNHNGGDESSGCSFGPNQ